MIQPLATQLRFARSEFVRCLEGVSSQDARKRIEPMNCLSWIVGHMADHEHFLWVRMAQAENIAPGLNELVGFGMPACEPAWEAMWEIWHKVTQAADQYLDSLTDEMMHTHLVWQEKAVSEDVGVSLLRNVYHYWFHLGEAHAIRTMLGHEDQPVFVGDMAIVRH